LDPTRRRDYKSNIGYSHFSFITTLKALSYLSPQLQIPAGVNAPSMLDFISIPTAPCPRRKRRARVPDVTFYTTSPNC